MEFKLNLITPTLYSQSGPNNCVDPLSEEFAEYVKHRADTEFNTPCKFMKVSGLAYIHSFEDFEERFLIHSEYAVIIASQYSQKAIKQFLPRLLVFLSSRSTWMNRFLFVLLGDVEVMDSLVVHAPIRFSMNQWKTHDEESWTALFDLIKVKWIPYVEEVIKRETITESPVSQSNDQHKTKKLVNVGTQGSLVFIDSYYYLSQDTLQSMQPSYKEGFSNTQNYESEFASELSKNVEGWLNEVNNVSKEISVYDFPRSKVTTGKTYKSESEMDSEPYEQFAFRTKVKDADINIKEKEDTIMNVKESKEKEFFKNVKEQINEGNNIIIGDNLHVSAEATLEKESEISVDPSDPAAIVKKRDRMNIMDIEDQNVKVEECGYSLMEEGRTEELEDEKIKKEENFEDSLTLKNIQKVTNLDIFMGDNQISKLNKDENGTKFSELKFSTTQINKKDSMSSEFDNDNNLMKDKTYVCLENTNNDDVYQKDEIKVLEETFEGKSSENIFPMTLSNNENVEIFNEERNLMRIYESKSNERSIEVVKEKEVFEDIVPCINTKVMIVDDVTVDDYTILLKKDQENKDTFKSKFYLGSLSDYDSQSAEVVQESRMSNIILTDIERFDEIENIVQSVESKIDNDNNDMETQEKNEMIEDNYENSKETSKHFINKIDKGNNNFKNETLQDNDSKMEYKDDSVHQSGNSDVFKEARKDIDHGKEDEKNETNKQLPSLTEKYSHEEYSYIEKDKLKLSEEYMLSKETKISESETNIDSQKYQNAQNDNKKESDSILESNRNSNLVRTEIDTDSISNLTKEVKENQSNINLLDKPLIHVKGNFLKEEISRDNKKTNERDVQKDSQNRDLDEKTKAQDKSYFEVQIKNNYQIEEKDTNMLQKDPSRNDSNEKESLRINENNESIINLEENVETSMNLIKSEITKANEKEKLCFEINPTEANMMPKMERNKNDIFAHESESKPEESAETSSSIQSNSSLNDNEKHFSTSSTWFDDVFKRAKLYSLHSLGSTENEVVHETNIIHRGNEQFGNNTDEVLDTETWYFFLCSRLRSIMSYITSSFSRHEEQVVDRDTEESLHTESSTFIQLHIIKWIRHPVGVFGIYAVASIISPYIARIIRHVKVYPWVIAGFLSTIFRNTVHYQQVIKPYVMDIIPENKIDPYCIISLEKTKFGNGLYTLIPER